MQHFEYYTMDPPAELAHYVRSYWVFKGKGNTEAPYVYRSMADPCAEMIFHYKGRFAELSENDEIISGTDTVAILHAPAKKFKRYRTSEDFSIFGAYLYPFAITDIFGLSSFEIQNEMPSVADCLGSDARRLTELILHASSNKTRADLLSSYLISRLKRSGPGDQRIHACVKHLLHNLSPVRIEDLTTAFNVSERQLQRKFKTITGFSPKTYARLTRFQHVLNNYGANFGNLTELAYESGYFDQSHFIHDFKEFSGYEPGVYFAGKGEGIEYRDS